MNAIFATIATLQPKDKNVDWPWNLRDRTVNSIHIGK